MRQYRRALTAAAVISFLVSIYNLCSDFSGREATPWPHRHVSRDSNVSNATLGYERIFVINLPSRTDRREAMALAAGVSNLSLTFLDGSTGAVSTSSAVLFAADDASGGGRSRVSTASSPPPPSAGARGSWHSHVSALQAVVDQELGSALILEDDVDWDVRLKAQMGIFAMASRTWLNMEAKRMKGVVIRPEAKAKSSQQHTSKLSEPRQRPPIIAEDLNSDLDLDLKFDSEKEIREQFEEDTVPLPPPDDHGGGRGRSKAAVSQYGDSWDVLWIGHCGADLPQHRSHGASSSPLKISVLDDVTVPAPKHLKPHPFALPDRLAALYPPHTRVVHAADGNVCSLAYAVSREGARKLLGLFTHDGYTKQFDLMLRDYCMGQLLFEDDGESPPLCLTVQPPLISHHYAGEAKAGAAAEKGGGGASVSNIRGQGGGLLKDKRGSPYIRLSVQENMKRLLAGRPLDELLDQLPDDGEPLW